ncbi:MAG TPA: hypothetical protein VGO34_14755 [Alphaproteobacteria bacterium]|jgi:hypothetical protein
MAEVSKHTPGPWAIEHKNPFETFVRGAPNEEGSRYVVAIVHPGHDNATEANARLIAAAPDLLDALKAVVAVADRKTDVFDQARAAIAKAEGRA